MKVKQMSEPTILRAIETLQQVQSVSKPTSKEWNEASKVLNELFAEMARREASND